jgi:hypothetical protein
MPIRRIRMTKKKPMRRSMRGRGAKLDAFVNNSRKFLKNTRIISKLAKEMSKGDSKYAEPFNYMSQALHKRGYGKRRTIRRKRRTGRGLSAAGSGLRAAGSGRHGGRGLKLAGAGKKKTYSRKPMPMSY